MTLRNKLAQIIYSTINYYNSNLTKEIEDVADKYAIEFADWVFINGKDLLIYKGLNTGKELLEEFKKEKGL